MDDDTRFDGARELIIAGRNEEAAEELIAIARTTDDPFTAIKCISSLKTLGLTDHVKEAADRTVSLTRSKDPDTCTEIATALRAMDLPSFSYTILKDLEPTDQTRRALAPCLMDLQEYESALDVLKSIDEPTVGDRILLTESLSGVGEHTRAIESAESIIAESTDYRSRKCYVTALIYAGRNKDAVKYTRTVLKEKTADANALAAYVLFVEGNMRSAAGYATRAIKLDQRHIGAMETLGMCLADKGEYDKARIVAGAINEISPGDRAAVNIISYCHRSFRS
ncbi:MAG: tetratricopeptide repeat protein [Candidatus Methanomethylophilaceae archaeon]|nr:tetratricopeptide repeat protein [Candidatus Methanomethylophilaceae archaeon]